MRLSRSVAGAGGALALILSALLGGAAAAAPADEASIAFVESTGCQLEILVSVPDGVEVDLAGVGVTVDGTDAEARAQEADDTSQMRRTAVLVIDTSNSMKGKRFAGAKQAASPSSAPCPDDVYVGIVSFARVVIAGAGTDPGPRRALERWSTPWP